MNARGMLAAVAMTLALAQPAFCDQRVPYFDIVDKVQELAAEILGRKKAEISTVDSLLAQGMNERQVDALVVAIQQEFAVALPADEIQQALFSDPVTKLSVRRLSKLVEKQMRLSPPI